MQSQMHGQKKPILQHLGSPSFDVTSKTVFLRMLPSSAPKKYRTLLKYLIKLICYNLWISHCAFLYDRKKIFSRDVIRNVRAPIRERCTVAFNTKSTDLGYSVKAFTVENIFAKIENDELNLNI